MSAQTNVHKWQAWPWIVVVHCMWGVQIYSQTHVIGLAVTIVYQNIEWTHKISFPHNKIGKTNVEVMNIRFFFVSGTILGSI